MPRNSKGWLKADALRQGIPDQRALDVDGQRHVIEILFEDGSFVTKHTSTPIGGTDGEWSIHRWECGTNLPLARSFFTEEVRKLGA